MMSGLQFEQAVAAFVTFFVVIDAVGVAPVFAVLACNVRPNGNTRPTA